MMKGYIGVKLVNAKPMSRLAYNQLRGWELPADENGADGGFLVEYLDGGKANHPDFEGYISWSPADVFENAYRQVGNMTFGLAIEALKKGYSVSRAGWNGKGMWLVLVSGTAVQEAIDITYGPGDGKPGCPVLDAIYMKTADDKFVPWLASQTDVLAEDWGIVGDLV